MKSKVFFFSLQAGQDAENDDLKEVSDIYEIPVIHGDAWVLESIRCSKHLSVSFFEASPSKVASLHFFKGHVFSVSGLGSKDVNSLWALIRYHGGQFSRELRPNTTILICGSKSGLKFEKATTKPDRLSLVTPDFVTDCVKQKQLLEVTTYHPRLLVRPGEPCVTPQARKVKKKRDGSGRATIMPNLKAEIPPTSIKLSSSATLPTTTSNTTTPNTSVPTTSIAAMTVSSNAATPSPSSAIISGPGAGPQTTTTTQQSQVTTTTTSSAPNTANTIPNSAPQLSQQQMQQQQQRMVRPPATSAMPVNPNIRYE